MIAALFSGGLVLAVGFNVIGRIDMTLFYGAALVALMAFVIPAFRLAVPVLFVLFVGGAWWFR